MSEIQDAAIAQIREVRHRISEQYGHDPQRLINYYLELQRKFAERLLSDDDAKESEVNHPIIPAMGLPASLLGLKGAG